MKGEGPGVIAPDGSPVDFYSRLGAGPIVDAVAGRLTSGAAVLDLGCGVGRIADPLAERGFRVAAVDEEPAMLARVRQAATVRSGIAELDLRPAAFDGVLLLSNLINHPSPGVRQDLLAACRGHLSRDGLLFLGHLDAHWATDAQDGVTFEGDGIRISLRDVYRSGTRLRATTVYEADGQMWRQSWENEVLDDDGLDSLLERAGLRRSERIDSTLLVAEQL